MNKGSMYYKELIDGLVSRNNSIDAKIILNKGYPRTTENQAYNELLDSLSADQKDVLAKLIQDARTGGIHDTLAYLNEKMDLDHLVLSQDGEILPHDEFASLHYDFICHCAAEEWPM